MTGLNSAGTSTERKPNMKKLITTKYVASEWECWKDEKYPYWYIGKTGAKTYLAMTYNKHNARLITAAPEMYKLVRELAGLPEGECMIGPMIREARRLIASIDGEEAEHEGTE